MSAVKQHIIVFFLLCLLHLSTSHAGARVALVIGNGSYQDTAHLPKLPNATNDAEDIAKALRGFGFDVIAPPIKLNT